MTVPRHVVLIIGGATAGAELAARLAEQGVHVVVMEQNARPYGKVEDGLPRWHVALRNKEYAAIDSKLNHPLVSFVPCTRVGEHVSFEALVREWGCSAVVLANGAWRDRPLPLAGASELTDRGLAYQNSFIYWFNHAHEASYQGPRYDVSRGGVVIGGGLASIDVAKAISMSNSLTVLARHGAIVSLEALDHKGIPRTFAEHRLDMAALPPTVLVYRRRQEDMPVVDMPEDADADKRQRVEQARARVVSKASEKYCFEVRPLRQPTELLSHDGRVTGLRVAVHGVQDGKVVPTDSSEVLDTPLLVSSIGSVPEPIAGLPTRGELYAFSDLRLGRFAHWPHVFAVGNVVTGRGNIVASRKHSLEVAAEVETFLGLRPGAPEITVDASEEAEALLAVTQPVGAEAWERIRARVQARQREVGYTTYATWRAQHAPERA